MKLNQLVDGIQRPTENDNFQFSAVPIPEYSNHRIAKDKNNNPTLLISISNQLARINISDQKLLNVSVLFDIKCTIEVNGDLIERTFTVVSFIGKDTLLRNYFLKLCSTLIKDLGNTPSHDDVRKEISRFIELFRLATEPQLKTVQGLWSELLLIAESKDPETLVKCWHSIPEEKFDFNNGDERIEVKSSTNAARIHNFSLDQLHTPTETCTIVASVIVKKASTGKSISVLFNEISLRLTNIELIDKLQFQIAMILGKSICESMELRFDYEFARDSLRFYRAEDVPKIAIECIPSFVSNVRFKSELTDVKTISPDEFPGNGELFCSI